jgi:hypothetical protein
MARSTKFAAVLPDGRVATRTSENRTYTHAVAYRVPAAVRVSRFLADAEASAKSAARYEAVASGAAPLPADAVRWGWPVEKFAAWAVDSRKREFAARADAAAVAGPGEWKVAGWCGRYELAVKLSRTEEKRNHEFAIIDVVVA